ncbi:peptidase dimerization domain-containing protein [Mesorhizobium sp. WSM3879]|uniref:peptidase dimerization domain-containing protein n=1 Tax=Mesorhizobium sp. WSM3879 TaxID=2029406 RepID=UPI001FDECD82|nr:peptidase dimerization domain-containing protein [Mesorhizobium sp. WSM3879]
MTGNSAHAAKPSEGADAIAIACSIVIELQKIVSREIDRIDPLVVSITGIAGGGGTYNVVAAEARLKGAVGMERPASMRGRGCCRSRRASLQVTMPVRRWT